MGFFKNFTGAMKENVTSDVRHLQGQGAVDKADLIYRRIKALFSGSWNLVIDKAVNLLLKSASKDLAMIVKECKAAGVDPFTYFPDNVKSKLRKSYN